MLDVDGMTCASCVARVEKALVGGARRARGAREPGHQPGRGAHSSRVGPTSGRWSTPCHKPGIGPRFRRVAGGTGSDLADRTASETRRWAWRLALSVVLLVPVVALHYAGEHVAGCDVDSTGLRHAVAGRTSAGRFTSGPGGAPCTWSTNMDTLVAIGTLAAYGSGVYERADGGDMGPSIRCT